VIRGAGHVLILCAALASGCLAATPELSTPRSAPQPGHSPVIPAAGFVEDASRTIAETRFGAPNQRGLGVSAMAEGPGLGSALPSSPREEVLTQQQSRREQQPGGQASSALSGPTTRARATPVPAQRSPSVPPAGIPATPRPSGRVGTVMLWGQATFFCVPGRSVCTRGYAAGGLYAAAGATLRAVLGPDWRGRLVRVSVGTRSVVVRLIDCLCSGHRLIDLYGGVFARLGSLSRGVIRVSVEVLPK
jgi:hypothetical protein